MRQVTWGWDPHSAGGQTGGSPSSKSHRLWSWVASPQAVRPGFHSEGASVPRNGCSCVLGMRAKGAGGALSAGGSGGGAGGSSPQAPGLAGRTAGTPAGGGSHLAQGRSLTWASQGTIPSPLWCLLPRDTNAHPVADNSSGMRRKSCKVASSRLLVK